MNDSINGNEFPIIDNDGGFFILRNQIVDQLGRIVGSTGIHVFMTFKRFCHGNNPVCFPKICMKDWAEYIGMNVNTFQTALQDLEAAGAITIQRPQGKDKINGKPNVYILNDIRKINIDEAIKNINETREKRRGLKTSIGTKKELIIKPLSSSNRFIDKIFDPKNKKIFKTNNEIGTQTSENQPGQTYEKSIYQIYENLRYPPNENQYDLDNIKNSNIKNSNLAVQELTKVNSYKVFSAKTLQRDKTIEANKIDNQNLPKNKKQLQVKTNIASMVENCWNNIPSVTTHRVDPENKTYLKIEKYISQLLNGTFGSSNKLDDKWLQKNKIPHDILLRPWRPRDVRAGIQNATKYSIGGYWPEQKAAWCKNLSTILFNPHSGTSMFLLAFLNPPKAIVETVKENDIEFSKIEIIGGMQVRLLEELDRRPDNSFRMSKLEACMIAIKNEFDKLMITGELLYDARMPQTFAAVYGEFLAEAWPTANLEQIGPKSVPYRQFKMWLKQKYDYDYEYKPAFR